MEDTTKRRENSVFPMLGVGSPESRGSNSLVRDTQRTTGNSFQKPTTSQACWAMAQLVVCFKSIPSSSYKETAESQGKNSFIDCCNLAETNSSADSLCHKTEVACFSLEFKLRIFKPGKDPVCILLYSLLLKKPWRSKGALHLCALHPSLEPLVLPREGLASHQPITN